MERLELDREIRIPTRRIFEHVTGRDRFSQPLDELQARGDLVAFGPGQVGLSGSPLRLLSYFDSVARAWGRELGAREHRYSSLISLETLMRADYVQSFPHQLLLASHLEDPGPGAASSFALIPAVCFHCYAQWEGRTLEEQPVVITARGRCVRQESDTAKPLERLLDFTMREIVVLGSTIDVERARQESIGRASQLLRDLALDGHIETANDPFFTRELEGKRLMQRLLALKYELRLMLDESGRTLPVASFNHHQDFFGRAFQIRQASGAFAHTGCIAFGLERWVLAFLTQHGLDEAAWPEPVRTFCERGGGHEVE